MFDFCDVECSSCGRNFRCCVLKDRSPDGLWCPICFVRDSGPAAVPIHFSEAFFLISNRRLVAVHKCRVLHGHFENESSPYECLDCHLRYTLQNEDGSWHPGIHTHSIQAIAKEYNIKGWTRVADRLSELSKGTCRVLSGH